MRTAYPFTKIAAPEAPIAVDTPRRLDHPKRRNVVIGRIGPRIPPNLLYGKSPYRLDGCTGVTM